MIALRAATATMDPVSVGGASQRAAIAVEAAPEGISREELSQVKARYGHLTGPELIAAIAFQVVPGRFAIISSFGSESAALLHMAAKVDRSLPVIFLDTGKLFPETEAYRTDLCAHLGLTGVRIIQVESRDIARHDPHGDLWQRDPNACCAIRKVWPLDKALDGFAAWATGRKRYQSGARSSLPSLELTQGRLKVNPLIEFTPEDIDAYYARHRLPRHPLFESGFLSIGCAPCTRAVQPGEEARAGRWAGTAKTECGIHL